MSEDPQPMDDMTALLVIAARCYDLLGVIARAAHPDEAEKVLTMHENGHLLMPPPSYLEVQ